MQTSVTMDNLDFEDFEVDENVYICIMLKDFKSIVTHAETIHASISAQYSYPNRPLRFTYSVGGMSCEYTLMTSGDHRRTAPSGNARQTTVRSAGQRLRAQGRTSGQDKEALQFRAESEAASMRPPVQPASRTFSSNAPRKQSAQRPSPPPPKASLDPESLFVQQYDDEDRIWGEINLNEDEETVGWGASAVNVFLPPLPLRFR